MDRVQNRRDTAAQWTSINPVLRAGELGIETDTNLMKIGDGVTAWNNLDYFADVNKLKDEIISYIVDSAPETLDTLNELAKALGDDPNFATTITNQIAGKANAVHTHEISDVNNLQSSLNNKANSSHTHTISEITDVEQLKTEITEGIVEKAPETLDTLNKLAAALGDDPDFATNVTNQIAQKADKTVATTSANGLMSSADKSKLDRLPEIYSEKRVTDWGAINDITTLLYIDGPDDDPQGDSPYSVIGGNQAVVLTVNVNSTGYMSQYAFGFDGKVASRSFLNSENKWGEWAKLEASTADTLSTPRNISVAGINQEFDGSSDINFDLPTATTSAPGLMSASDKTKLDGIDIQNLATKSEVNAKVSGTGVSSIQVVATLPDVQEEGVLYIVTGEEA